MEIKKGQRFRCVKDVVMYSGRTEYRKGFTYVSHRDGCITDDSGDERHEWSDDMETWEHFELYEPDGNEAEGVGYREFETGSRRDSDAGKPLVNHLSPYLRLRVGYHMRLGANKYGKANWRKGQPTEVALESLHRHLAKWEFNHENGIEQDECHLSACIFNIMLIMQNEQKAGVPADYYYNKLK